MGRLICAELIWNFGSNKEVTLGPPFPEVSNGVARFFRRAEIMLAVALFKLLTLINRNRGLTQILINIDGFCGWCY